MSTEKNILLLFDKNREWSIAELSKETAASRQMVHRIIKRLEEKGVVKKLGLPPKTIYRKLSSSSTAELPSSISAEDRAFLQENFLLISETGDYLEGYSGFYQWCQKRMLPLEKTLKEFIDTKVKYEKYYEDSGIINGTPKLTGTKGFDKIYLSNLYYLDFYAIERFGKTVLGTLLHFAKQGQNKYLSKILLERIKPRIEAFIIEDKFDAVGYIPPTIKREMQLMSFLRDGLNLQLPHLKIQKISGLIPVPQKSLNKMEERVSNADLTFAVHDTRQYERVLLIDDAVGSGATLNQVAAKILTKNIARRVTGLAVVGSFKGFDVITDV